MVQSTLTLPGASNSDLANRRLFLSLAHQWEPSVLTGKQLWIFLVQKSRKDLKCNENNTFYSFRSLPCRFDLRQTMGMRLRLLPIAAVQEQAIPKATQSIQSGSETINPSPHGRKTKQVTMKLETFADWQAFAQCVNARAKRITDSIHNSGWQIAADAGIPRDLCCLHNASIDDDLKGWCHNNPDRLKAAKRALHFIENWEASHKAVRIIRRAWNKMAKVQGWCHSPE